MQGVGVLNGAVHKLYLLKNNSIIHLFFCKSPCLYILDRSNLIILACNMLKLLRNADLEMQPSVLL